MILSLLEDNMVRRQKCKELESAFLAMTDKHVLFPSLLQSDAGPCGERPVHKPNEVLLRDLDFL